ncbi:MAG: hypothetical protein IJY44_02395 [Bacteroidaceae bacterium]|nr:hypothetical protein [Bacteroidaceae bacterium]
MIDKEESELYDALSRELGEPLSPYEELVLLGVYDAEWDTEPCDDIDEEPESDEGYEIDSGKAEEYEFDENDEEYRLLAEVLRYNGNRTKYFA